MKMGVKEFRERFSEIADGGRQVLVTKNGRIVGRYDPVDAERRAIDWDAIERRLEDFRAGLDARNPGWRTQLAEIGLDRNGEPLER